VFERVRQSDIKRFFGAMFAAAPRLASAWWILLLLAGLLPAGLVVAMGHLVSAVQRGDSLGGPLTAVGILFVALQIAQPVHAQVGAILGQTLSTRLNHRLLRATTAPEGMAHLERPDLIDDLTLARDFDLGISGPPMSIAMGFIAAGLVEIVAGLGTAAVLFGFRWWAPLLLGAAWGSTHWLLKEAAMWHGRHSEEVRDAQRYAEYAYRMAVDPPASKELRLFGLSDWTVDSFARRRRRLVDMRWQATRLRQRPVRWALLIVTAANLAVFWSLGRAAAGGGLDLGSAVTYAAAALGTSSLAFGGLSWALVSIAPAVGAVERLETAMAEAGRLVSGTGSAAGMPRREVRFRAVSFQYEAGTTPVLEDFDLTIPAGTSLAIVGQNGAGKTTLAKLLCRLYDPQSGTVEVDGVDIRELDLDAWRHQVAAVFQDFVRYDWPLRDNVAPGGAPDEDILAALADAGAGDLAQLDTILSRSYEGGTDFSGGQWQRIALARALCAVRLGAGVVILDEPTAQLDVRGEAEIFARILTATRSCTTILISHRFSTVRHADRICVLEHGHVVELGSHDELIALGGRYRTMFELQAARFDEEDEAGVITLG